MITEALPELGRCLLRRPEALLPAQPSQGGAARHRGCSCLLQGQQAHPATDSRAAPSPTLAARTWVRPRETAHSGGGLARKPTWSEKGDIWIKEKLPDSQRLLLGPCLPPPVEPDCFSSNPGSPAPLPRCVASGTLLNLVRLTFLICKVQIITTSTS